MRREKFLFRWFQAEDGCPIWLPDGFTEDGVEKFKPNLEAFAQANPSSWVDPDDLEREARRLPEFVFRRLHLNQWTETEDAWITAALWDACSATRLAADIESFHHAAPLFIADVDTYDALDVGIQRDSTAIVWAQWHTDPDGVERLHVGQTIMDQDTHPHFGVSDVREEVGRLAGVQPALREFAFDPFGFLESAEMLSDRGLPMVRFDQSSANMGPASEHLYELIKERRLVHDGNPAAREQVLNAVVAATDRGWRLSKRKSRDRIDFTVALAMASERALAGKAEPAYGVAAW
jgi:phage terminase large subunit-like protein